MTGLKTFEEIISILGFLVRFLGFLAVGFGIARFVLENYKVGEWQVKISLALGYFALFAALTYFASPGSAGAFALGGGVAMFMAGMKAQETRIEEPDKEEKKKK